MRAGVIALLESYTKPSEKLINMLIAEIGLTELDAEIFSKWWFNPRSKNKINKYSELGRGNNCFLRSTGDDNLDGGHGYPKGKSKCPSFP